MPLKRFNILLIEAMLGTNRWNDMSKIGFINIEDE
jgi:hypothetical protein